MKTRSRFFGILDNHMVSVLLSALIIACGVGLYLGAELIHLQKSYNKIQLSSTSLNNKNSELESALDTINQHIGIFESTMNEFKEYAKQVDSISASNVRHILYETKLSKRLNINELLTESSDSPSLIATEDHSTISLDMFDRAKNLSQKATQFSASLRNLRQIVDERAQTVAHIPFSAPINGWMSSGYGWRNSPFTGEQVNHRGIDIAADSGTEVVAPASGYIKKAEWISGYGAHLVIDHQNGLETKYAHLGEALVKEGDKVEKGDTIALVGNTGRSTGPHLHYEVIHNDKTLDPENFLDLMIMFPNSHAENTKITKYVGLDSLILENQSFQPMGGE